MKSSNSQNSLNSISKHLTNNHLQLVRFLSYLLILVSGMTIGIFISFYLKNGTFTQFSLSGDDGDDGSSQKTKPQQLLQMETNITTSSNSSQCHGEETLEEFIEPSNAMHHMNDEELLWRASMTPKIHEYPFDRVPKVAFMFLVRGPVHLAPFWQIFFQGHERYYTIYIHSNPSYNVTQPEEEEAPVFHGRRIPSKKVGWGQVNMIEAERRLLANALLDFSNQRFVLISESCIPLFNFSTIYSYLMNSTQSYVMAYDENSSVGRGRYRIQMAPKVTIQQWRKGSQWFEMDRGLALEVVSDKTYFPIFQNYCIGSCYSDEHYLPTFISIEFWERNSNRSLTWVDWSKGGPHPAKFVRPEVTVEFLENLRSQTCEYNGNSTNVCFLFARKFLPSSLTRLMRFAPKVMHL